MADSVEASLPLRCRWHVGQGPGPDLGWADDAEEIDWQVSVDSTITRAHQHGSNTTRPDQPTGGWGESRESRHREA